LSAVVAHELSKSFRGIHAVDGVSFEARDSIVGLIGPNGAGKTTLFNLISGYLKPDAGDVRLDGASLVRLPVHEVTKAGVGRTFQVPRPFKDLSVRRNVAIAALLRAGTRSRALEDADQVMELVGLSGKAERPVRELGVADHKRVEMAKALATRPRVLLLDEVFSGLNPTEMDDIIPVVRRIHEAGVTILLVEHVLRVVMRLCAHVLVLHQGRLIAQGTPDEVVRDPATVEAYLGLPLDVEGRA
jgi:branched-chain amino acid transport system ATP-binding protein